MASKKNIEEKSTELSAEALAARAAVASRPRQSVVRFVQLYRTIKEAAPERLEELFGSQIDALEEVADLVDSPIQVAIDKVAATQVELAVKGLTNTDPLNGYAGYTFNRETFDEKTREKKPRTAKSKTEKVADILKDASPEDLAALQELLAARGA